jgi:heterodisulfide reductase subunit B
MELAYFPGCTLYTKATHLDHAGRESLKILGYELKELEKWTCCGASFPLVNDYHMGLASSSRVIADTHVAGYDKLVALCSVCFNVLKRTNYVLKNDSERNYKINEFIERDYQGEVEILHYLEVLRDIIGFDKLKEKIVKPLEGLKVAVYYGCLLLRPYNEIQFDDPESPTIFEDFASTLGCEPVYFPFKNECCGAFQVMNNVETANRCSKEIIDNAILNEADLIVTSCPLCQFNLDDRQEVLAELYPDFKKIPVIYLTQLLGLALGLDYEVLEFNRNFVDPVPVLKKLNVI